MKVIVSCFFFLSVLATIGCGDDSSGDASFDEVIDPDSGDITMGNVVYQDQCSRCHGSDGQGTGGTEGVTVNITNADASRIQFVVRTSGPGIMPLFAADDISTADLNDLIRYILETWP